MPDLEGLVVGWQALQTWGILQLQPSVSTPSAPQGLSGGPEGQGETHLEPVVPPVGVGAAIVRQPPEGCQVEPQPEHADHQELGEASQEQGSPQWGETWIMLRA